MTDEGGVVKRSKLIHLIVSLTSIITFLYWLYQILKATWF